MESSQFIEKLNKVDGNVYVIEEEVHLTGGVYEAPLAHDNINTATLAVFTGPKLTGDRLETYAISTPSLTPWKRIIRVYADVETVYISYETDGDTVEAEDINQVQGAVVGTQEAVNAEEARALDAEKVLTNGLQEETNRAGQEEARLDGRIDTETMRAQAAENVLTEDLVAEVTRAQNAEKTLTDNLVSEVTRAKAVEQVLTENLGIETARAQAAEKTLTDNMAAEIIRSKGAEKTLADNLSAEVTRAKAAEKKNADNLSSETTRAQAKETELQGNIDAHTSTVAGELQALKAADTALDEKKANTADVNQELGNRYTKDQVFTKQEVLQKIEDLIGSAPDTLDTFKEIADALGNDPNFAATIMNELSGKVDKVTGKQLTSNDYSDSEKAIVADVNAKKHTHSNKSVIDKITQGLLDNWSAAYTHISDAVKHITAAERTNWTDAYNKRHEHGNKTVLDKITQTLLDNWSAAYTHISNKSNPHGVTKSQVGLGNVPNVATNDQVPTFTQTATLANLTSGEKLTVMLGKIAKVIADFITHKADGVQHITATERTNWNDADSKKHTHSNKAVIDKVTQAMLDKLAGIAPGAEVNVQSDWSVTDTGSDAFIKNKPASLPANGGTASKLSNAIQISNYDTFVPPKVAAGAVTPIMANSDANSPWSNTTAGLLIQSSAQECWHILIFRSGSGGWAYRSYYQETWSAWKIWSTFDGAYSSLTGKPSSFPPSSHTHTKAQITDFPVSLPASDVPAWAKAASKPAYGWTEITGKPSTFTPAAHTHTKSQISDMPTKLSQFTNDSGYITQADVDTSQNHTHANKAVLDKISQSSLDTWNGKAGTAVATQTVNGLMAAADKKKLDGVATGANNYAHPTTSGNKHIPSGGASGQILRWSADGTAVWGTDNNTTYSVFKAATASAAGGTGLVPAPAAGTQTKYLRADGTWQTPPNTTYTHPNSGVTAGTYRSVTVNAQGHVTAGTNPTTLSGYGITDAAAKSHTHNYAGSSSAGGSAASAVKLSTARKIGNAGFDGTADITIASIGASAVNHNHDGAYLKKGPLTWNDLKGV